jgi:hypothetical protein
MQIELLTYKDDRRIPQYKMAMVGHPFPDPGIEIMVVVRFIDIFS